MKTGKMFSRILSALLVLTMVLSMVPAGVLSLKALADETTGYSVGIAPHISGGTVTANPSSGVQSGQIVSLDVKPINSSYQVKSVSYAYTANGTTETQPIQPDANGNYSFTMPESDVVVTAVFEGIAIASDDIVLDKETTLEDNGTYTIDLSAYTKSYPVNSVVRQSTPLDIVLVIDQSGSIKDNGYLNNLKLAVDEFVSQIAAHGRSFEVEHRIAIVGFASDADDGVSGENYTTANGNTSSWVNTGLFDSHGVFHNYDPDNAYGFTYTQIAEGTEMDPTVAYYAKITADGETYYKHIYFHEDYYDLITEDTAKTNYSAGIAVYGYVESTGYVEIENKSNSDTAAWVLKGTETSYTGAYYQLYNNVWTHRDADGVRVIHGYYDAEGNYVAVCTDLAYTRSIATDTTPDVDIYKDALMNVTSQPNGQGTVNPSLSTAIDSLAANGATRTSYGMLMANAIFATNPLTEQDIAEKRKRVVVLFTDGVPGYSSFEEDEANSAIAEAYVAQNTHGATVYTIGLFESGNATDDVVAMMQGISSNYPDAMDLDDVYMDAAYVPVTGELTQNGNYWISYRSQNRDQYREIFYGTYRDSSSNTTKTGWFYRSGNNSNSYTFISSSNDTSTWNKTIGNNTTFTVVEYISASFATPAADDYYHLINNSESLYSMFSQIMKEITSYVTDSVKINAEAILRDILGTGLVLTDETVITASIDKGSYANGDITWTEGDPLVTLNMAPNSEGSTDNHDHDDYGHPLKSATYKVNDYNTSFTPTDDDPNEKNLTITVYNTSESTSYPPGTENNLTHPHTVDVSGFDFKNLYINEEDHTTGARLRVKITNVEATDSVIWSHAMMTNNAQSGLWSPLKEVTKDGKTTYERELLASFYQPTTVFVERVYVMDYAKSLKVTDAYFSENGSVNHLDNNNGGNDDVMNGFTTPVTSIDGLYGNINIVNNQLVYTPTTMQWAGYDEFYAFGKTSNAAILAQDANGVNRNLWAKFTIMPANNVYYEDTFITTEAPSDGTVTETSGTAGIEYGTGFQISQTTGTNEEVPESLESTDNGGIHGWIDDMANDTAESDGTFATGTGDDNNSATATFTFKGTGFDIYTRTNSYTGIISVLVEPCNEDGTVMTSEQMKAANLTRSAITMDQLSKSGIYYQVPTITYAAHTRTTTSEGVTKDPYYGTFKVTLTVTNRADNGERVMCYLDGIRIYNPLGWNITDETVKDAYGDDELNAVFTEVREVLLDYEVFAKDETEAASESKTYTGAVFIDWIKEGQEGNGDTVGTGVSTKNVIGTYEDLGPKNEVYLSYGQSIVLKVDTANTYYVGLKSLTGAAVKAQISGKVLENGVEKPGKVELTISHSTDMYYEVTPDADGYIVIKNNSETEGPLLSITKLRTTNANGPVYDGGILPIAGQEASTYANKLLTNRVLTALPVMPPVTEAPTETQAPATEAPTETEAPATEAPTETEAPATEAPVETQTPATEAPVETQAPATEAPVETQAPATEAPVETQAPATEAPAETQKVVEVVEITPTPIDPKEFEKAEDETQTAENTNLPEVNVEISNPETNEKADTDQNTAEDAESSMATQLAEEIKALVNKLFGSMSSWLKG